MSEASQNYLLRTFQDYGIQSQCKNQEEIHLQESFSRFNSFSPELFDCSLEQLDITCAADLSDKKFEILSDILENVQNLSDLKITFEDFSMGKSKLLSNFIGKSKSLQRFSSKIPSPYGKNSPFEDLIQRIPTEKLSSLSMNPTITNLSFEIQLNPTQAPFVLEELKLRFSELPNMFYKKDPAKLFDLRTFIAIHRAKLSFEKSISMSPQFLLDLFQTLKKLRSLQELELGFANVDLLNNPDLTKLISQVIFSSYNLKKINLFLARASEESKNQAFDYLFSPPQQKLLKNHKLEEFTLTLMKFGSVDFQKIINYLRHFSHLKKLVVILNQVALPFDQILTFLNKIPNLNERPLISFEFICRDFAELDAQKKNQIKAVEERLSSLNIQPKVIFEKLMPNYLPEYIENDSKNYHNNEKEMHHYVPNFEDLSRPSDSDSESEDLSEYSRGTESSRIRRRRRRRSARTRSPRIRRRERSRMRGSETGSVTSSDSSLDSGWASD